MASSIAAGSSMLAARSLSASFIPGSKAQAAWSNRFHASAGHCGQFNPQRFTGSLSSERILRSALRTRIGGESKGFGCKGLGSGEECRFGAEADREAARRRLLLSSVVTHAGRGDSIPVAERILAALGYLLPFFDGIQYGRYFFMQFPIAEGLLRPLFPLLSAYKGFPYSNFIAFFSLYLLVVRNSSFSRYVRFNAMQAVVLDVLLILPTLVERTFGPRGGIGLQLLIIFYNSVFLFLVSCFLFGTISCMLGKTPRLPIVADAADAQVEG